MEYTIYLLIAQENPDNLNLKKLKIIGYKAHNFTRLFTTKVHGKIQITVNRKLRRLVVEK